MTKEEAPHILSVGDRELRVTHPSKLYFREAGISKLELVDYYLAVAEGALLGIRDRPLVLKRYVNGAAGEAFYQKRAPKPRPEWLRTVELAFPSGRTAEELVIDDAAGLAYVVNLGCIELHPHAVRSRDLEHPDELRIDLDPGPGVPFADVRLVALEVKKLLDELGLRGFPKTSGSRGMHILVRIEPRFGFEEVRRAALALAREVERRVPKLATSKWWKEERHGVFIDYNQNAKDKTTASAYSVRPLPDARVSTPLFWEEVPDCDPAAFTVRSVPARLLSLGDPARQLNETAGSIQELLALAEHDDAKGLPDAPWPPHHPKGAQEAPRVAPSRARGGATNARAPIPILIIANAQRKEDALLGLERWKQRHPQAAAHVAEEDVLVDSMRGRSSTWTRIRVNLRNVPSELRPAQATPDPNESTHTFR